jgi:hypothetical protein
MIIEGFAFSSLNTPDICTNPNFPCPCADTRRECTELQKINSNQEEFMRIIIAGIVGGIVMFLWGGFWHEQLPFGFAGLRSLPNEQAVLNGMKANIPEAGMYIFPGFGLRDDAPYAQKKAAMQKLEQNPPAGPQGVLVYSPVTRPLSGRQLMTEGLIDVVQALFAVFLLAQARLRRYASRVGFVFVAGLLASITTNIAFWNWYGFPSSFVIANIAYLVIGYFLVGLVGAAIVKTSAPKAAATVA